MQSVRFYEFGNPAKVLRVEDVPQPEPGENQVLVRLRVRSINPSDLLNVRGLYGSLPKLPATPGLEGMGEVVAVGDEDMHGYDFWLDQMGQQPNNYIRMVCAFITSAEYQLRFSSVVSHTNAECGPLRGKTQTLKLETENYL